jgi:hypothetical protein
MTNEECPICLEKIKVSYSFNGCSHSICVDCSIQMKTMEPVTSPFSNNVTIMLGCCFRYNCSCKMVCLRCPLCRTPERLNKNMELLRKNHRDQYDAWLDIELRWNGNHGYRHMVDTVQNGYGRKNHNEVYVVGYELGDVISPYGDIIPQKYRLINKSYYSSYKDQIKEQKRSNVSKCYKPKKILK